VSSSELLSEIAYARKVRNSKVKILWEKAVALNGCLFPVYLPRAKRYPPTPASQKRSYIP